MDTKTKVRRQHYVWRKYLKPWTTDGKIWCRRGQSVFQTNLMNIAQKRDFYSPQPLTEYDRYHLRAEAAATGIAKIQTFVEEEIALHDDMFAALKQARRRGDEAAVSKVENLIHNSEEGYQSLIESEGAPALEALASGNVAWATVEDEWRTFIRYFATQYLRTKRIQDQLGKIQHPGVGFSNERTWPILRHLEMVRLAEGIYRTTSLELVESRDREFITSDQPAFNAMASLDPKGAPTAPHLFCYPVSPHRMVLLVEGPAKPPSIRSATPGEVARYNGVMVDVSQEQIYARSREQLQAPAS